MRDRTKRELVSPLRSLSRLCQVFFLAPFYSLLHPGYCKTPSVEILRLEAGDKIFGDRLGTTTRCGLSSSSLIRLLARQIRLL
jgi:hypothetical protein